VPQEGQYATPELWELWEGKGNKDSRWDDSDEQMKEGREVYKQSVQAKQSRSDGALASVAMALML
jgi:hypothetical protein